MHTAYLPSIRSLHCALWKLVKQWERFLSFIPLQPCKDSWICLCSFCWCWCKPHKHFRYGQACMFHAGKDHVASLGLKACLVHLHLPHIQYTCVLTLGMSSWLFASNWVCDKSMCVPMSDTMARRLGIWSLRLSYCMPTCMVTLHSPILCSWIPMPNPWQVNKVGAPGDFGYSQVVKQWP